MVNALAPCIVSRTPPTLNPAGAESLGALNTEGVAALRPAALAERAAVRHARLLHGADRVAARAGLVRRIGGLQGLHGPPPPRILLTRYGGARLFDPPSGLPAPRIRLGTPSESKLQRAPSTTSLDGWRRSGRKKRNACLSFLPDPKTPSQVRYFGTRVSGNDDIPGPSRAGRGIPRAACRSMPAGGTDFPPPPGLVPPFYSFVLCVCVFLKKQEEKTCPEEDER